MKGSFRKPEIAPVDTVEVVDPLTIKLYAQGAVLAAARPAHRPRRHDGLAQGRRSGGRQVRPEAGLRRSLQVRRAGPAGPHRGREVRRLLEQGPGLHRQDHLPADRRRHGAPGQPALRRPRPDRARAGDRHQERCATIRSSSSARRCRWATSASRSTSATAPKANTPLAKDARVRRAFELAIDRDAINQVVFNGEFVPGNQWVSPQNPYYQEKFPIPKRDVAKAKALLKEAGVTGPIALDFMVPNGAETRAVAEVVQSMAAEAGFDLKIRVTEFATSLKQAEDGDYQVFLIGWSGRSDPDGNSYSFQTCGSPQNNSRLLRQGGRCRAQRGARQDEPRRPQEGLREGRREVPRRRLDHLPLSHAGAGRAYRQARGLQADARRPRPRRRPQAEVAPACSPSSPSGCCRSSRR